MADRPTLAKKGRQGEKIGNLIFFYFASRPHISRTTRLTKMVHLSKFAEFHKGNSSSVFNTVYLNGIFSCFKKHLKCDCCLLRLHMYNHAFWFLLKYFLIGYLCNTSGHCFFYLAFFFFADRPTLNLKNVKKNLVNQIFFIFHLPTDRLHTNGSPQIRHSKDQPTMA